MINKKIAEITAQDILDLVAQRREESSTLDFKEQYDISEDKKKAELLADISAFANTAGGDIVFGIKEKDGEAEAISPIKLSNPDEDILTIESLVRDWIEPRCSIEARFIRDGDGGFLVIRVAKSLFPPHRVIYTGSSKIQYRFFGRNSAGKYQMDIGEIRRSFVSSELLGEQIASFRTKRLLDIWSGTVWSFQLGTSGKVALHIIPFQAFSGEPVFESVKAMESLARAQSLYPIGLDGYNSRINYEWYANYIQQEGWCNYVQVFRNGIIEAVECGMLTESRRDGKRSIPSIAYEAYLLKALDRYARFIEAAWISGPFSIHLSLLWVKGCELAVDTMRFHGDYHPIDREILETPSCVKDDFDGWPEEILRPMFDVIWNVCWFERSFNFDEAGAWSHPRDWQSF